MSVFAYEDPPYFGCARKLYGRHHPDAARWDTRDAHLDLVQHLRDGYDGAALSCLARDLVWMLPACPPDALVAAWVKPFGSGYKPDQRVIRAWEPVIYWTPRRRETDPGVRTRDVLSVNSTQGRGLPGAKPSRFNRWIADLLGVTDSDDLVDLFPGSGGMGVEMAQGVLL